jgi:hypothetical protein
VWLAGEVIMKLNECIISIAVVIAVPLTIIVPEWCEIREVLTATGMVWIENALDDAIVIEDIRSGRQLARIEPLSNWSDRFDLADNESGRSLTTFRIVTIDGRSAMVESRTFISHRAEVRDHGVDLRAMSGKGARSVTETIEWRHANDN